jgi:UDPglucose--hexose-1-phosphate uridylyltransferase
MSQLRQDPVSGDWVVIAPGRSARPHELNAVEKRDIFPKENCPFHNLHASGNEPIAIYPKNSKDNWEVAVIPNKFPILEFSPTCPMPITHGPYKILDGKGRHELVVTRDHNKNLAHLTPQEAAELFKVFAGEYSRMFQDSCVEYVSLFNAWGPKAGASIYHPHYQMLALPIIPPEVSRSLAGSKRYWEKNGKCIHCALLEFEKKEGKRIIFENEMAVAFAPFASRQPFEVRIYPKLHIADFKAADAGLLNGMALVIQQVLLRMENKLGDPDYNFFVHTAPRRGAPYYHFHLEILPKTSILGGLEWGTGIIVNQVDPDSIPGIFNS